MGSRQIGGMRPLLVKTTSGYLGAYVRAVLYAGITRRDLEQSLGRYRATSSRLVGVKRGGAVDSVMYRFVVRGRAGTSSTGKNSSASNVPFQQHAPLAKNPVRRWSAAYWRSKGYIEYARHQWRAAPTPCPRGRG